MADGNVASILSVVPGGVRAATDALVASLQNLERAEVALLDERRKKVADKIDAFIGATRAAVSPADAVRTQQDLVVLRQAFEDQEKAFAFWTQELNNRLNELAASDAPEVINALNAQLAVLKERQAREQVDVENVALLIAEFEERIAAIQSARPGYAKSKKSDQSK
jgi:hypothetical protein